MLSLEPDLSNYFNFGLVPPPDFDWEPPRLRKLGWQPSPAQLQTARWQLFFIIVLVLIIFMVLVASGRL